MDRFRKSRYGPSTAGPSKASPSTVCQKCLKKGHYSYECKETLQSRPYISRPSRTQQLLNPKLVPKLNDENPNELLRKEGIADEQLAKIEQERGRKLSLDDMDDGPGPRGRIRSTSATTTTSVSTISTRNSRSRLRSRSRSPLIQNREATLSNKRPRHDSGSERNVRRRYSTSTTSSYDSYSSQDKRGSRPGVPSSKSGLSPVSSKPTGRGRRHSRSRGDLSRSRSGSRVGRRGRVTTRSLSRSSGTSYDSRHDGRGAKRRHTRNTSSVSSSPRRKARQRSPEYLRNRSRSRSRLRSRDRSPSPYRRGTDSGALGRPRKENGDRGHFREQALPARKERSLSPYSKRIALTRSMNNG